MNSIIRRRRLTNNRQKGKRLLLGAEAFLSAVYKDIDGFEVALYSLPFYRGDAGGRNVGNFTKRLAGIGIGDMDLDGFDARRFDRVGDGDAGMGEACGVDY